MNNANVLQNVSVMFEYGYTGDYITGGDLAIMRDSINTLRTNRQALISNAKTLATTNASNYGTYSNQVTSFSSPTTNYDAAITTATGEKSAYDTTVTQQALVISTQDALLTELDKQISDLKTKRTAENDTLNTATIGSKGKQDEIDKYNKSKTDDEATRKLSLQAAQTDKTTESTNFNNAINSLKTNCVGCVNGATSAATAFVATPYVAPTVQTNVNSIPVATV